MSTAFKPRPVETPLSDVLGVVGSWDPTIAHKVCSGCRRRVCDWEQEPSDRPRSRSSIPCDGCKDVDKAYDHRPKCKGMENGEQ